MDNDTFGTLSTSDLFKIVYEKKLSICPLVKGSRRLLTLKTFDHPEDDTFFPRQVEKLIEDLVNLFKMMFQHGIYRIFIPSYSLRHNQKAIDPDEYRKDEDRSYLLRGIDVVRTHPLLLNLYREMRCQVRFCGNISLFPPEIQEKYSDLIGYTIKDFEGPPNHYIFFTVEDGNPHDYIFKRAYEFGLKNGRAPEWEDMLEIFYGDRTLKPLDFLIGFNRIASTFGIPHLLDGYDRIYVAAASPLVMSPKVFRRIIFDYLYNRQDQGRNYKEIPRAELQILKEFDDANKETITGLTVKRGTIIYPLPSIVWPTAMYK